jgi:Chromo (CHRromatin Organisation MOdifier) domain
MKTVHCTRIKFYHDASLGVTEELKIHLQYQDSTLFVIEQLLELLEVRGQVQVLIQWMGFDDGENTWEPVTTIREEAPDLLLEFLEITCSALASKVRAML